MLLVLEIVRLVIDVSMWLVLGRLVVLTLVRRDSSPFRQAVVRATEPIYRMGRLITARRVPERWLGLVCLVALGLVRVPVALALRSAGP